MAVKQLKIPVRCVDSGKRTLPEIMAEMRMNRGRMLEALGDIQQGLEKKMAGEGAFSTFMRRMYLESADGETEATYDEVP